VRRSATLFAIVVVAAGCSSASSELARMQDVPLVVSVDDSGSEVVAYDPTVTVTAPTEIDDDLFEPAPGDTEPEAAPVDDDPPIDTGNTGNTGDDEPTPPPDAGVPVVEPVILERFPHDGTAFTQGLEFADGVLIESLGLFGESARRRVAPTTGEVTASARLGDELFAAGLTVIDSTVVQLTWQQGIAIVSDLTTMFELSRFTYDGEGWGLCELDDGRLAMSNGSGFVTFRDVTTFEIVGEVEVTIDGEPATNLNELECVGGSIYANVWLESNILEIDVATGVVQRIIDASGLLPGDLGPDDVLNGIAYRAETDTFFLTGKRWTVMYEVDLG
jgi:glutaminyl-peptide cyclotransferase